MSWQDFSVVEVFVCDLHGVGGALSGCSDRSIVLRRRRRLGTGRWWAWRATEPALRRTRRNAGRSTPTGTCVYIETAAWLLRLRLNQDSVAILTTVWHGSLPQLSRENDAAGLICGGRLYGRSPLIILSRECSSRRQRILNGRRHRRR